MTNHDPRSKQHIKDSTIGGKVRQQSDVNGDQSISKTSAKSATQRIKSQVPQLGIGNKRAFGVVAVVGLVVILVAGAVVGVLVLV